MVSSQLYARGLFLYLVPTFYCDVSPRALIYRGCLKVRNRKRNILITLLAGIFVLAVPLVYITVRRELNEFLYPRPNQLPRIVEKPLTDILQDLDSVLKEKAPLVASQLQDGLAPTEIDELEHKAGIKLTDGLRSFYMWHNGCSANGDQDFIPGHVFLPLGTAIERQIQLKEQVDSSSAIQRWAFSIFAGHRRNWITIFEDLCGDGYFYDPSRKDERCCIFYCLAEDGYVFFPSLGNLLEAITECYTQDAYSQVPDSNKLNEDYKKSVKIFARFGTALR